MKILRGLLLDVPIERVQTSAQILPSVGVRFWHLDSYPALKGLLIWEHHSVAERSASHRQDSNFEFLFFSQCILKRLSLLNWGLPSIGASGSLNLIHSLINSGPAQTSTFSTNTKYWPNSGLVSGQRRRPTLNRNWVNASCLLREWRDLDSRSCSVQFIWILGSLLAFLSAPCLALLTPPLRS